MFRHQYGQVVAALLRSFGPSRLALVEDVVQEALVQALRTWPFQGIPKHPDSWLIQVARNRALDVVRRERLGDRKLLELATWGAVSRDEDAVKPSETGLIADDTLRLIFMSCHPQLAPEVRIALTLKIVCGFGVAEVARALLAKETAISQRLVRAKSWLAEHDVPFDVPSPTAFPDRLDSVLEVLYLMFNEGYSTHHGQTLVRVELVEEALRLVDLALEHPDLQRPKVHALRAIFLLQGSRLAARQADGGELLTLANQDRSLWNRSWIAAGLTEFDRSIVGDELSPFHVEAAIAALHASARTYADTDWRAILLHYDTLQRLVDSPIVTLNRAVAVAKVRGFAAALRELDSISNRPQLARYHLFAAVRGLLLWTIGDPEAAAVEFERAANEAGAEPERTFLERRAELCRSGAPPPEF